MTESNKKTVEKYPPFSVLMSVYKNEKPEFLDYALKSIEYQTILPTEIILVEDGQISAELKAIIKKHKNIFNGNFKDIVSTKNQGLGKALRLGTTFVSTEWIARMDSDDYSVPNRFELQLKAIIQQPNLAVIGGQVKEFASNINNIIGARNVPTEEGLIRDFIKWRSPFNHPTVMINKKVLLKVGGYLPFGNLEDYYLWARIIASKYEVKNISEALVYMRTDEGMYARRGKISNVRYVYKLRKYLYKSKIISFSEKLMGDLIFTANILMPSWLRKSIYQKVLHKK